MKTHDEWFALLERQALLIDTFEQYIARRKEAGEPAALSEDVLADEVKRYRSLLSQAPLDVLFEHSATSARSRHI